MIPFIMLHFQLQTDYPLDFGANPGSSIRGALYEALRVMYDTQQSVHSRHDGEENPVAWLMRLEDEAISGSKDVPRPLAIRPPLANQQDFGLTFYGSAQQYLSLVLSAVAAMQQIGLGRGRQHFQVQAVDTVEILQGRHHPLLNAHGQSVGQVISAPSPETYYDFAKLLHPERLTIQFLTPTRIIQQGQLCHAPIFRVWFQRLLERTRLISELYTETPVWIPFRDLLAQAEQVRIVQNDTTWSESWSGSRRDGWMKPTSGFMGIVRYEGRIAELLPWLLLGQALQVGKNTMKGCGWYQILYEWR